MLRDKGMKSENIWEFEYQLLISKNDPLSQKNVVDIEDLSGYIEICHGDPFVPSLPMSDIKKAEMDENVTKRVYVYSRARPFGDGAAHIYVGLADGCGTT